MLELTALLSRSGRAVAMFLNFYVSHGSRPTAMFLRDGEKCYIYFVDNLLLFPTVKELSKSINSKKLLQKFSTTFLRHSVFIHCINKKNNALLHTTAKFFFSEKAKYMFKRY